MRGLILGALLTAGTALGDVTFVTPQAGAQAVGPQIVEVTTTTQGVDRVEFYVDDLLVGVARSQPYRIAYDFGTSVEPRHIRARVLSDGYRRTETADVVTTSLTAGESMNVDVVEVPLRVRSPRMLNASDIRVRENSVQQTVSEILPGRGAAHFAFVVDRSLSMGNGKLASALAAVDAAASHLRADDTASLILFNHHVERPRMLRGKERASALASTRPSGGTSMRDAVASSVEASRRTYVIVVSDGGDRNSILSDEDALRRISGTKTVVSAVVLGDSSPFLGRAASATGGTILTASAQNLRSQVERLIDDINSRYTVVYQSSGTADGWRTIDVTPLKRGVKVVSARKRYFAE